MAFVTPAMVFHGAVKTYLELKQGTKHELWQIEVEGATTTITSGKVGAKKPPKVQTKTAKSGKAAADGAAKEIAKRKAAFYFDPSTIEGILEAHDLLRGSLKGLKKLTTLKVYSQSPDEGDVELFAFVHELPALKIFGVPCSLKEHFAKALPNITVD